MRFLVQDSFKFTRESRVFRNAKKEEKKKMSRAQGLKKAKFVDIK